jgi:PAS domain S-box-containing protein
MDEQQSARLLLIEDDLIDQMAFQRAGFGKNENLRITADTVSSLAEAKVALSSHAYDIIVSDNSLPDGSGLDVLELANRQMPVIVVSDSSDETMAAKAIRAGASDYIVKDSCEEYLRILPFAIANAIDRKKYEKQIETLSLMLNKAENAILISDKNGIIEWVNEAYVKMTGYKSAELIGTSGEQLRKGQQTGISRGSREYEYLVTSKKPISYEVENYTKNGTPYWVYTTLTPILDANGELDKILAVNSNITRLKNAEESVIRSQNEGRIAEEEFLANTSHEIITPLNGILGMTGLMKNTELSEEQRDYLNTIQYSANNLLAVVSNFIEFSKVRTGHVQFATEEFSVRQVMEQALASVQATFTENPDVTVSLTVAPSIPALVNGDAAMLGQVLNNLVGNSFKFTRRGHVRISAEKDPLLSTGEICAVRFIVEDTGIGIPSSQISQMFQPYKQGSPEIAKKYGGLGLGLSIASKLLELQGGTLVLQSEENAGCRATFSIPFKNPAPAAPQLNGSAPAGVTTGFGKLIRVLIVEDNVVNQKVFANLLKKWGAEYAVADNGKKALEILREDQRFDLILMDVRMPEMDGIECTRIIRTELSGKIRNVPVIAVTASVLEGKTDLCKENGMNDYLSKPFTAERLHDCMLRNIVMPASQSAEASKAATVNYLQLFRNSSQVKQHVNLKDLFELADGDENFINEILASFLDTVPEDMKVLRMAVERKDWREVGAQGHKLKSSSALMGVKELESSLLAIEMDAIKGQNLDQMSSLYNRIALLTRASLHELNAGYDTGCIALIALEPQENIASPATVAAEPVREVMTAATPTPIPIRFSEPVERKKMEENLSQAQEVMSPRLSVNPALRNSTPHILVAEDDKTVSRIIEFRLRKEGYDVSFASNGKEAIDKIDSGNYDLLLTDLMMPFFNGLEVVSHVRNKARKNMPIIILSAVEMEETVVEAFKIGANDFLTKPFSPHELSMRIKKYVS